MKQESLFLNKTKVSDISNKATALAEEISALPLEEKIQVLNEIKIALREVSPFKNEPVDCVLWVHGIDVFANDYNPNAVAPPEMKLLEHSIQEDGYTQPIVTWKHDGIYEVVDGFHRHRVGKESKIVNKRVLGYLPAVVINSEREDRGDRIAATIRHNRTRGKHKVEAMSDIVVELKRRNWSDEKIAKNLGMDADEVLRLTQITGLAEVFKDQGFSQAWEIEREEKPSVGGEILSDVDPDKKPNKDGRIYHTWEKWECFRAGFYEERPPEGMTQDQGEEKYREFLADLKAFEKALKAITSEWKFSCEHYLTNDRMNRIAWLGQASVAYALGIPSCCRGGYHRLTDKQKKAADEMALKWLNKWLKGRGLKEMTMEEVASKTEAELY